MRRLTIAAAAVAFVATVWLANYLVDTYGPIRVWPTSLYAPAGVYMVGLAFLLRDTVQRLAGQTLALACVAVGTVASLLVSERLAVASAVAFAASELVGLVVFAITQRRSLAAAVTASQVAAAALDSYVFLTIAFGSLAFFEGQFVAKLTVVALAAPFVLGARRALPA